MSSTKLNPQQLAAVTHVHSPLLVIAGAGSGKTKVITEKILHLMLNCQLKAHNIVALTFTNKAANEMHQRIKLALTDANNPVSSRGLRIATFHSFGLSLLRIEHALINYPRDFSIYDPEDCLKIIAELTKKNLSKDKKELRFLQNQLSDYKEKQSLARLGASSSSSSSLSSSFNSSPNFKSYDPLLDHLWQEYEAKLHQAKAVDFDDLLLKPVQILSQHPEILAKWQDQIRYLLIDEYQDTNQLQYRLVRLLTQIRQALTVVGDDHQSIYAWRGAQVENLLKLQQDYQNLEIIKLEENYRSTGNILKAANHLISHNNNIFEKNLWSSYAAGPPLLIQQYYNEHEEAYEVISHILQHKAQYQTKLGDYAILYRSNHQARIIEQACQTASLPYQISGGNSFFSRSEVKDILAYIRLLINPNDDQAFLRIVNLPKREIGEASILKIQHYASEQQLSYFVASQQLGCQSLLSKRAANSLANFINWLMNIHHNLRSAEDPIGLVKQMIKDLDYEAHLQKLYAEDKVVANKLSNIEDLLNWLTKSYQAEESDNFGMLSAAIHKIMLVDMLAKKENEEAGVEAIKLSTIHASKGLEYPYVYIVGFEENLLPHRNSIDSNTVEEERRLAYVALTRAKLALHLSIAKYRGQGGNQVLTEPSRFLQELPIEVVEVQSPELAKSLQQAGNKLTRANEPVVSKTDFFQNMLNILKQD